YVCIFIHSNSLLCLRCTDPSTSDTYTLSLHDALPILNMMKPGGSMTVHFADLHYLGQAPDFSQDPKWDASGNRATYQRRPTSGLDRKSTRLNSSHDQISYAVFCLKKKKNYRVMHVQLP